MTDIIQIDKKRSLRLPKANYGSFCLKILHDFMKLHNLVDLPTPVSGSSNQESLSRIFDIILHSMGQEKREEILKNLDEYMMDLPAHFR